MRRGLARGLGSRVWMVLPANPLLRRGVAGLMCLAVVAALVVAAAPRVVLGPLIEPVAVAPDEASASIAARRQGSRVEVAGLRSESSTTFANPDGSWTLEQSVGPVRVRKGAGWVPVDRALTRTAGGALVPKASPAEVEFSGGGRVPLARFSSGGKELVLTWPDALPDPVVDGDTATYPEVLPGVDLRVRATDQGFGHDVVVKSAAAAADPTLARIVLGVEASGVRLAADKAGNLSGVDDAGTVIFHAPAPLMWDSGSPRVERRVGVEVGAGTLTLVPDATLLGDPDARFPLVIDPAYSGHAPDASGSWTLVRRAFPDIEHWNLAPRDTDESDFGVARVGHAPGYPSSFLDRSLFRFDSARLAGTVIKEATFKIWQVWKYAHTCTASAVDPMVLYQTDNITHETNWINQPAAPDTNPGGVRDTKQSTPKAGQAGCPPNWVGMNATYAAQLAANAGAPAIVLGLSASDEGGDSGWKRFYVQRGTYPTLAVTYNHTPAVADVGTDPALVACRLCGGVPYVGATDLNLKGTVSDKDGGQVAAEWAINTPNPTSANQTLSAGHIATTPINTRSIPHGTTVTWSMRANDGELASPYVEGQRFVVDRVAPVRAPKVSARLYKEDNRWHGGVGVPDRFTFAADPVLDDPATPANEAEFNDIDHYLWGWQDPPATRVNPGLGLGGGVVAPIAPVGDGPRTLYVRSVDRAGNPSPTKAYRFYVRAGNGPLAQWSLEGNTQDTAFLGDRHGTLAGAATYLPGAVGNAVKFQGGSVVAPSTVGLTSSFSVSAWVRADSLTQKHIAVSQSGNKVSAFQLGYLPDSGGRWYFGIPRADTDSPTATTDTAFSAQPASTATWTHLTGVFDAATGWLRLYVNGELAGSAQHTANLDPAQQFPAGPVRIGSGVLSGAPQYQWVGAVDEVTLYDRVLEQTEIAGAVSQSNVQLAHWKFDEALDPAGEPGTTARNSADGGDMAVLRGGATFTRYTRDEVDDGAVAFDGVDGVVTTNKPTIRTDQSFSVAAWVWLDPDPNATNPYDVISQDGEFICSFCLQYQKSSGNWVFVTPTDDALNPQAFNFVVGAEPAAVREWTHLAGTYDASTDTLAFYVNGNLVGTKTGTVTWRASGAVQIGRGKAGGGLGNFFRGMIDDVRLYSRAIGPDEVFGLMSAAGVTAGSWRLDGDVLDSSGNKRHGILTGESVWTAGQTAIPDATDRALRLSGTGAHVSASHAVATDRSFSVSAWVRADQVGRRAVAVSQDGASRSEFVVGTTTAGQWTFAMPKAAATNALLDEVVGGAAQVGVWTHLAAVYSGGRLELFVNGDPVGSVAHIPVVSASGGFQIGRAFLGGQGRDYFEGAVDDVAVYARPLATTEIRSMAGRDLSLVHNWQLDETSGTVAADSVGARGGTLSGGATFDTGRVGNSVWADNGTVTTTGTDLRTDQSFTVSAWVRLTDLASAATAVSVDGTDISKFRLGYLAPDDQNPFGLWAFEMPVSDDDGAVAQAALSTMESEVDQWVHLVGVYDSTSGMLWLYVNGTRQNDRLLTTPWHGAGGLRIGGAQEAGVATRQWTGGVDDVRLYTGALGRDRVTALHNSYPAAPEAPKLPAADAGQWRFDEAAGTVAADQSGRGYHASLRSGASWLGGRNGAATWLDGTSGHAQTAGPVLNTHESFSVSAWAYLDSTGADGVVVGQDGAQASAFQLRFDKASGRWAVLVPTALDRNNPDVVLLTASEAAWTGEWTHLGVVYDAEINHLALYVNGALVATRYGVRVEPSSGAFSIGRGRWNGGNAAFFARGIDDVRVFGDVLDDGEMRLLHDDVPTLALNSWRFDDGTARDYELRGNHATATGGAAFGPGISGQSLVLDGVDDAAVAAVSGVGMRDSFTVSAWAKLSRGDRVATVLGQDSTWMSGLVLQYRPESGRWIFGAPMQDADGAALSYAASHQPAVLNQWVHLTGVYDRAAQQLKLYGNGQLSGTLTRGALWAATGAFTIGRGKVNGQPAQFFPGAIDEVRVDQGLVGESDIARRASWPAPYKGTLGSFVNMAGDHYTAPTAVPVLAGYRFERTLGMPVVDQPGTRLLYSCRSGTDMFTSVDPACEGQVPLGEVGRVYIDPPADVASVPIHRCAVGGDRFDSRTGCGTAAGELLGYTAAYAPLNRYFSFHFDHWTTIDGALPGYVSEGRTGWVSLTQQPGTQALMSCRNGVDEFTSLDPACEGRQVIASVGYVYSSPPNELLTAPLYRCRMGAELSTEQFTSGSEICEGRTVDRLLGHVLLTPPVPVA